MTPWSSTPRPNAGMFPLPRIECRRCGRACYATIDPHTLTAAALDAAVNGQLRCRGCDESAGGTFGGEVVNSGDCYCPEARETA